MNEPGVLERVSALLPPGAVPSRSPIVHDLYSLIAGSSGDTGRIRRYNLLYAGTAPLVRTFDLAGVFAVLERHLHLLVAHRARRRVFVRAGVVGWGDSAILVPGARSPQISALIAGLVHAGAAYYSDMYAVLDNRGGVHPYPTPLFHPDQVGDSAARVNGRPEQRALPVRLIAVPARDPGAEARALPPGRAVVALLGHTVAGRRRPATILDVLERTVADAASVELDLGAADRAVDALLDRLDPSERTICREKGDGHVPRG